MAAIHADNAIAARIRGRGLDGSADRLHCRILRKFHPASLSFGRNHLMNHLPAGQFGNPLR